MGLFPSPSAFVRRRAVSRGLLGGSRGWLAVGAVVWGARLIKRFAGRSEEIAATEVLRPGEFVTIRAIAPPTRRQRRAAKSG